jgi:hypothetical protein
MAKIAQTLLAQANAALDDDNATQAAALLQQAAQAAPDSPALRKANARLGDARERLDAAKRKAQLTPADLARIQQMLAAANQAMTAGNLILPPGDCAFDKYRAVLAIDADNAAAMEGLAKIPARAKELFEQAIRGGTPNKARAYIDAVAESDPGDTSVSMMRSRLADVFLDQTQSFIAQKRRAEAGRALDSARELNPNNPRLAALRAQFESMSAN